MATTIRVATWICDAIFGLMKTLHLYIFIFADLCFDIEHLLEKSLLNISQDKKVACFEID